MTYIFSKEVKSKLIKERLSLSELIVSFLKGIFRNRHLHANLKCSLGIAVSFLACFKQISGKDLLHMTFISSV